MTAPALDEVLATTRTVRRRLDLGRPVDPAVLRRCLELATCAPNGANRQDWRFLVIDEPELKAGLGVAYRAASEAYLAQAPDSPLVRSARAFADRVEAVPVWVLACLRGRLADDASPGRRSSFYGSVYPAVWSFMLAARGRGLGTALTTVHLAREREVAALLGIPYDEVTQVALVAVGHLRGDPPGPPPRGPVDDVIAFNGWDWP